MKILAVLWHNPRMHKTEDNEKSRQVAKDRIFSMIERVRENARDVPVAELERDVAEAMKTLREDLLAEKERGPA